MRLKATKKGQYISLIEEGEEFEVAESDEEMFNECSWADLVEDKPKSKSKAKSKE